MTDTTTNGASRLVKETSERAAQAYELNLQMGKAFMDAWSNALSQSPFTGGTGTGNGNETSNPWGMMAEAPDASGTTPQPPFANVTRVWLNAITQVSDRVNRAVSKGETLTPDAFVDIWSKASAEITQAVVSDTAFASLTGQWVNTMSRARAEARKTADAQLREFGFATHSDVDEVGQRLVELERRVHELTMALEEERTSTKTSRSKSQKK